MSKWLVSKLRELAAEADEAAGRQLEVRDAEYYAGQADAFREAALLVKAEADE